MISLSLIFVCSLLQEAMNVRGMVSISEMRRFPSSQLVLIQERYFRSQNFFPSAISPLLYQIKLSKGHFKAQINIICCFVSKTYVVLVQSELDYHCQITFSKWNEYRTKVLHCLKQEQASSFGFYDALILGHQRHFLQKA